MYGAKSQTSTNRHCPGEKLHETMITEDDARYTVELVDRYIIEPPLALWNVSKPKYNGEPVSEEFRYSSDTNYQWLDQKMLKAMLNLA